MQNRCNLILLMMAIVCAGSFTGCGNTAQTAAEAPEINTLIKTLQNKDPGARRRAIWSLGELNATDAVNSLILALGDKYRYVAFAANASLVKITGHYLEIPVDWEAYTIAHHFKPRWEQWQATHKSK